MNKQKQRRQQSKRQSKRFHSERQSKRRFKQRIKERSRQQAKHQLRQRIDRKAIGSLAIVLSCAIVLFFSIQFFFHQYLKSQDDGRMLSGISVAGIDVSGKTTAEALQIVQNEIAAHNGKMITFQLENGSSAEVVQSELGVSAVDLDKVVQDAYDYGRKGNALANYKILKASKNAELQKNFAVKYQVSEERVKNLLAEKMAGYLNIPVNAAIVQTDAGVTVVPEQLSESFDFNGTVEAIHTYLNQEWEKQSGYVTVAVIRTPPEITAADLNGITDLLGSYTTSYSGGGANRILNVESGARHLNGILVRPGEEISVNAKMEPYTEENGYAAASSYESNIVVQTMGGGICQVSTTLYNALLYAELEITERYPHSMLVSYVAASRDAAIADNLLDLKFKNDQAANIYIEAVIIPFESITFNIYGKETRPPGRTFEFVSESTPGDPPEGTRFMATENTIGYIGLMAEAQPSIAAALYKVVYENGVEVSRDVVNYSQYMASPRTMGVGTYSANPEHVELINSAIASQNEETINAVIEQILNDQSQESN